MIEPVYCSLPPPNPSYFGVNVLHHIHCSHAISFFLEHTTGGYLIGVILPSCLFFFVVHVRCLDALNVMRTREERKYKMKLKKPTNTVLQIAIFIICMVV